jgi:hypothetical protein
MVAPAKIGRVPVTGAMILRLLAVLVLSSCSQTCIARPPLQGHHPLIYSRHACLRTGGPTAPYHQALTRKTPLTQTGSETVPKELKNKRDEKKKATLTPKEKKAAKRAKQESKLVKSA